MKPRLNGYRIRALALALIATGSGCAPEAALRPEPSPQQTAVMVEAGQFAALDRYYAEVQARYDNGSISDERLRSAFRHFYDSSPELAAQYAKWVKEMPDSYVAHLARAIYYIRVGEASRGDRLIAYTSEAQLNGMDAAFAEASSELRKSLTLDKKPILSVFYQLDIGKFEGDAAQNRALLQDSLAIDPKNFIAREMYMLTIQTAWGGGTQQLKAFVADSRTAGLSTRQMQDLESIVFGDEAWVDEGNENFKRAAAEYLEAMNLSGDETCMLCAGRMLVKAQDFPNAARVLTQYLARDGESTDALALRAYAYAKLGRGADAAHDYERAADLGDADSQYNLGLIYLLGELGVPQDRGVAILWLQRAAAQGNPAAERLLPIALNSRIRILPSASEVLRLRP